MEVSEDVLAEFICAPCQRIMHPPIKVCIMGHSICDSCYHRVIMCPECGADKNLTARNFSLESLHSRLIMPCSYFSNGCTFKILGTEIKKHEQFCAYSIIECPLKAIDNCPWFGQMNQAIAHCLEHHPLNAYSSNNQQLMCSKFYQHTTLLGQAYHILLHAHGEMFRCIWNSNLDTGYMLWSVTYIGPCENANKYYYEVEFRNQTKVHQVLRLRAGCKALSEPKPSDSACYMLTHMKMFKNFCCGGNLHYAISIHLVEEGGFENSANPQVNVTVEKENEQEEVAGERQDPRPCTFRSYNIDTGLTFGCFSSSDEDSS